MRVPDVLVYAQQWVVRVAAPGDALLQESGHVEERRLAGVERAHKRVVQQVVVEGALGLVDATHVHRVALLEGALAPEARRPHLAASLDHAGGKVVHVHAPPQPVNPLAHSRWQLPERHGRHPDGPRTHLCGVHVQQRPVHPGLGQGRGAVHPEPAGDALAKAMHAAPLARAVVCAVVGTHGFAPGPVRAVHALAVQLAIRKREAPAPAVTAAAPGRGDVRGSERRCRLLAGSPIVRTHRARSAALRFRRVHPRAEDGQ
mmetsp:Transcript_32679/g.105558  ORF Transcript_32679/g.105558 Transcript_32679/m.105558 type:complete len:259 (-) Transcript_32679:670-1446(-)|eukprot:scaffold8644_cov115-Isochrysis_galbana.AAC.3